MKKISEEFYEGRKVSCIEFADGSVLESEMEVTMVSGQCASVPWVKQELSDGRTNLFNASQLVWVTFAPEAQE